MSFKDVWYTALVATVSVKLDENVAKETLLETLRRRVESMKPEDVVVHRVDHRSLLKIEQPGTRRKARVGNRPTKGGKK